MMKNNEFKTFYLIITVIIALGILLGGYNFYQKYLVEKPLSEKLTLMKEVEKVDIKRVNKTYSVQIYLGETENIQKSYINIESTIDGSIKSGNYKIVIKDNRNKKLDQFYNDLQPALYQGLDQKEFLWLDEQIKQCSEKQDITARLLVDNKRVYLQLEDGNSYLYSIIDRTAAQQETERGRVN